MGNAVVVQQGGGTVITLPVDVVAKVLANATAQSVAVSSQVVPVSRDTNVVTAATAASTKIGGQGQQGPPGAPGTPGDTPVVVLVAGEQIYGSRAVRVANDVCYLADSTAPMTGGELFGIALGAASTSQNVSVQTGGLLTEPSWNWSPGKVWVSAGGVLTQNVPTVASGNFWLAEIGTVVSPTQIQVRPNFIAEIQ